MYFSKPICISTSPYVFQQAHMYFNKPICISTSPYLNGLLLLTIQVHQNVNILYNDSSSRLWSLWPPWILSIIKYTPFTALNTFRWLASPLLPRDALKSQRFYFFNWLQLYQQHTKYRDRQRNRQTSRPALQADRPTIIHHNNWI
jgi:hypothetical protein